jgi:exo-beta-1,3-glucanase (GH17 family)
LKQDAFISKPNFFPGTVNRYAKSNVLKITETPNANCFSEITLLNEQQTERVVAVSQVRGKLEMLTRQTETLRVYKILSI